MKPTRTTKRRMRAALAGMLWVFAPALSLADAKPPGPLESAVDQQLKNDGDAVASQHRVEDIDDQTRALLKKYEQLTNETKSMNVYSDALATQVASQNAEIDSTQKELDGVDQTSRDVIPMMQKMVDRLDRLVKLDVPFLVDERTKRVDGLKKLMDRADVTISEKYRRIVEAYQIEMDYGRSIEAYQGELDGTGPPRTVQFLRIGRVALLYQTLDGKETGYWNANTRSWVVDNDYRKAVQDGVSVALKRGAPDLIVAPVPAPQEVSS